MSRCAIGDEVVSEEITSLHYDLAKPLLDELVWRSIPTLEAGRGIRGTGRAQTPSGKPLCLSKTFKKP